MIVKIQIFERAMQSKIATLKIVYVSCSVPYIQIKIVMDSFCIFPHSSFLSATRIHNVQLQSFNIFCSLYFSWLRQCTKVNNKETKMWSIDSIGT